MTQGTVYFARLNGRDTTAKKMGRTWLVGGDKIGKGDSASIAIKKECGRSGWYHLRGAVLVFEDYLTDDEILQQAKVSA